MNRSSTVLSITSTRTDMTKTFAGVRFEQQSQQRAQAQVDVAATLTVLPIRYAASPNIGRRLSRSGELALSREKRQARTTASIRNSCVGFKSMRRD